MNDCKQLDQRSLNVIKELVEEFTRSDKPVASHELAGRRGIDLKPASVRSILSHLEERGLIERMHTSSGRRPTPEGMHIYIKTLLRLQQPSADTRMRLEQGLRIESTNEMVTSAMEMVADLTQLVTLVSLPASGESAISNLQFMRLSANRIIAVLITANGEIRNRLLKLDVEISVRDLEIASQFFNENFAGRTLEQTRKELHGRIANLHTGIAKMLQQMLVANKGGQPGTHEVQTTGQERLYANSGLITDAEQLQDMLTMLQRKETLLQMLDCGINTSDVSVFIGIESGVEELKDHSLVVAPYKDDNDNVIGVLGLIGPYNMEYGRIMPIMEATTSLMTDALGKIRTELF